MKLGFLPVILLALISLLTMQTASAQLLSQADNEAKEEISDAFEEAMDGRWGNIDMLNISKKNDNSSIVIYNTSQFTPEPIPTCGVNQTLTDGVCIPDAPDDNQTTEPDDNQTLPPDEGCPPSMVRNQTSGECEEIPFPPQPEPEPEPEPTGGETKLVFAGDYYGSTGNKVINAQKQADAYMRVALGDMGYKDSLGDFKKTWVSTEVEEQIAKCTIGNHDAENRNIYAEAIQLCGQLWFEKVAGGTTLVVGFDTDGNLDTFAKTAVSKVGEEGYLEGIKNVFLVSHKPCYTHDAHHGVEKDVKAFCDKVAAALPDDVKVFYIGAHNHENSMSEDGTKFVAGGGGRTSHQGCGNDWAFCSEDAGYLEITIDNDSGAVESKFINVNGEEMS